MERLGKLDREVTIQQTTKARSSSGAVTHTWSTLATVWASKDQSGREFFKAQQRNAQIKAVFFMHYRSDVTPQMRIVDDESNTFEIVSVLEVGRKRQLRIEAKALIER